MLQKNIYKIITFDNLKSWVWYIKLVQSSALQTQQHPQIKIGSSQGKNIYKHRLNNTLHKQPLHRHVTQDRTASSSGHCLKDKVPCFENAKVHILGREHSCPCPQQAANHWTPIIQSWRPFSGVSTHNHNSGVDNSHDYRVGKCLTTLTHVMVCFMTAWRQHKGSPWAVTHTLLSMKAVCKMCGRIRLAVVGPSASQERQ